MSATARLLAAIGLNNEQFKNGIASTRSQTGGLHKDFSALKSAIAEAFTIGAIVSFIGRLKAYADAAKDAADQTGATAESIQALTAAGIDNAASQEKLKAGLLKIRAAQVDSISGNESMRASFERLGIKMEDIEGVGADRVFELIGKSINSAENQATALAAASDILGTKLISSLTPALKAVGSEGLDPLIERMKKSGKVMDEAIIAKIKTLSDKWENAKNQILISITNIVQWLERLSYALTFALATKSISNFGEAWDEMAAEQEAANQRAVESAKNANAAIIKAEEEKVEAVSEEAKKLEAEKNRAAKESGAAEIEAARKSKEAQDKYLDDLAKAQGTYYKAFSDAKWDAMSAEEQLQALEQERLGILAGIRTMEAELSTDQLKTSVLYYQLKTKEWTLTGDIEQRTRDLGKARKDENTNALKFSKDEITALGDLRNMLKDMSDAELDKFLKIVQKIHGAIGKLDFSGLMGLMALQGFKIPNESIDNADQFGRALNAMAGAMGNLKLPDLAPLEVLKGFKIPNESVMNARQFGNAIAEMVKALNKTPLDLAPLQEVADLFTALKSGTIQLQIAAPSRAQLTLSVDESFQSDLSSLAASAKTIATFKGTIYG